MSMPISEEMLQIHQVLLLYRDISNPCWKVTDDIICLDQALYHLFTSTSKILISVSISL